MAKTAFVRAELKGFIERVERLEEQKSALAAEAREVYAQAKGKGFDVKIMRQVVRIRRLDPSDAKAQRAILDLYLEAIGFS